MSACRFPLNGSVWGLGDFVPEYGRGDNHFADLLTREVVNRFEFDLDDFASEIRCRVNVDYGANVRVLAARHELVVDGYAFD